MIVINCHDSWSTIVMIIVLFYYCDSSGYDIELDYRVHFMQPMFSLLEHCIPDHLLAH